MKKLIITLPVLALIAAEVSHRRRSIRLAAERQYWRVLDCLSGYEELSIDAFSRQGYVTPAVTRLVLKWAQAAGYVHRRVEWTDGEFIGVDMYSLTDSGRSAVEENSIREGERVS